jgi:hypothetical protein
MAVRTKRAYPGGRSSFVRPTERLDELREMVTETSWPQWKAAIASGFDRRQLSELNHISQIVRHPAA